MTWWQQTTNNTSIIGSIGKTLIGPILTHTFKTLKRRTPCCGADFCWVGLGRQPWLRSSSLHWDRTRCACSHQQDLWIGQIPKPPLPVSINKLPCLSPVPPGILLPRWPTTKTSTCRPSGCPKLDLLILQNIQTTPHPHNWRPLPHCFLFPPLHGRVHPTKCQQKISDPTIQITRCPVLPGQTPNLVPWATGRPQLHWPCKAKDRQSEKWQARPDHCTPCGTFTLLPSQGHYCQSLLSSPWQSSHGSTPMCVPSKSTQPLQLCNKWRHCHSCPHCHLTITSSQVWVP